MSYIDGAEIIPRHILKLSTEEKRNFLESFDYVFSDIDGVVWNVEAEILGAPEGFEALKLAGKSLTFITNNSVRPTQTFLKRFANVNMEVDMNDVVHPAKSIVTYLKNIKFEGLIYIIASDNFKTYLKDAGFRLKDGPNEPVDETYTSIASKIFVQEPEPVRAVVFDVDFNLSFVKLVKAQLYMRDPNCILITGATDMLLPVRKNINIIGPGPFIEVLTQASNRTAATLGKPGKELVDILMQRYNIENPKRALMIGDMLEQDVGFGKKCGFQTLAVLSGGATFAELKAQTNPQFIPDYYAESMADFLVFFNDIKKLNL